MWTLEIEDVKSNTKVWEFDEYCEADDFLAKYFRIHGVEDHHIGRIHDSNNGTLIEESGELYRTDNDAFHANYTISRNNASKG